MSNIAPLTEVSRNVDTVAKFVRVIAKEGVTMEQLNLPINNLSARRNLTAFLAAGCPEVVLPTVMATPESELTSLNPQWIRAREIMGKNFFGVEEAIKYFGVNPTKQQLAYLAEIPFTEEVLRACKDTHVLVAVFTMSILDIRGKVERKLFYSHDNAWYNKEAFAKNKGEVGWQLVRKAPIADSTNKTWNEQQALLENVEETPKAQVIVYTTIGHFLATGERLFENVYIRCSDLDSGGHRVDVGCFDADSLSVGSWSDDTRDGDLGVSAARKQRSLIP